MREDLEMRKYIAILAGVCAMLTYAQAYAQLDRLSAEFLRFNGTESATSLAATGTGAVPGTGGIRVYSKTVFVPFMSNSYGFPVLYITISAIGDNHGGESNNVSCNVDGPGGTGSLASVCNPTPGAAIDGAPPGWTTLTHHFAYEAKYGSNNATGLSGGDGGGGTSDMHDNDYYYTWCKNVTPGTHTINLRLGNHSGATTVVPGGSTVFFEKTFVYIDASPKPPFAACSPAVIPRS